MSSGKRNNDDDWIAFLAVAIVGAIVGGLFAWWQHEQNKVHFPDTLEPLPPIPKEPFTIPFSGGDYLAMGMGSVSGLLLLGSLYSISTPNMASNFGTAIFSLFTFVGASAVGYAAVNTWQKSQTKKLPRPPRPDPPRLKPLDLTTAMIYTISLPHSTEWRPELSFRFMEQILFKLAGQLTFRIVAEKGRIVWQLVDLRALVEPSIILQAIHASYPDAEVEVKPFEEDGFTKPFSRYVLRFKQAADFVGPIQYVTDLKQFDPLAAITQEMARLNEGERISYTLYVVNAAEFAYKEGEKLVTRPNIHPLEFISMQGMMGAAVKSATGQGRAEKYVPQDQKVFREKLNSLLFQSLFLIQVDAVTPERVRQLALLDSHVWQYVNQPYNAVVWVQEPWPDCIREITGPEDARATSTFGLLDSWLTNTNTQWKDMRLILEPRELASLWHLPHDGFTAANIVWSRSKQVQMPSVMAGKRDGVCLGINRYAGQEEEAYLPQENRTTHAAIIGMTGMGKSTLLHRLIHQDIQAGRGVAVIDPHGKLIRDILQTSIPGNREKDVVVFDLANSEYPPPLNPLRGRLSAVASGQILSIIERLFPDTSQYARLSRYLRAGLGLLQADREATIRDLGRLFTDFSYRERLLADCFNDEIILTWHDFGGYSEVEQNRIRDPILNRISPFYSNPDLLPMLCHPDTLDFKELICQKKILLISLKMDEELVPEQERSLIGALLISRLQLSGMKDEANPYHVYIDEVQKFVTTSLDTMFSEARKFGLALTIANQYFKQLAGHTLEAAMGNVGALVIFQCGRDDAQLLAPYVKPNFDTEDLINLDMHNAVVKMRFGKQTQPAFSLVTKAPLTSLSPQEQEEAEARETRIRRLSIETYTPKSRSEIMKWLKGRYQRQPSPKSGTSSKSPAEDEHGFDTSSGDPIY